MILNARYQLLIALLCVTAGCATSPVVLRSTGAGAVAFGGSLAEAELMVGEKASGQHQDAGCGYVEFRSLPGLRFTVEGGVVTRADAGPGVRNALGVQLGDTTDSVVSLYPDVTIRRSQASVGGTDLIVANPDGRYAIVMEAAGNKIIAIRAGLGTSVGSAQGCP
jgi:hypothetical protein